MIASLLAAQQNYERILLIDPIKLFDWDRVSRTVDQVINDRCSLQKIVCFGRPLIDQDSTCDDDVQKAGRLSPFHLHKMKRAQRNSPESSFRVGNLTMVQPAHFLEAAGSLDPIAMQRCTMALQNSETFQSVVWPDLNTWSALRPRSLRSALADMAEKAALRPADFHNMTIPQIEGSSIQSDCENCTIRGDGHFIALSGCNDLEIVSTRDATLIRNRKTPNCQVNLIEELTKQECAQLFQSHIQFFDWGIQEEHATCPTHRISTISIHPGKECDLATLHHGTIIWTTVSGNGHLKNCQEELAIQPGKSGNMDAGHHYTIKNGGEEDLVMVCTLFNQPTSSVSSQRLATQIHTGNQRFMATG